MNIQEKPKGKPKNRAEYLAVSIGIFFIVLLGVAQAGVVIYCYSMGNAGNFAGGMNLILLLLYTLALLRAAIKILVK